ncbi:MAG: OmpA family protein [Myxococcota bacterium]
MAPDRTVSARAEVHSARDPLVWIYEDGEKVTLLSDLLAVEVLAGYTVGRLRAGVDVPLYLLAAGDLHDGSVALGDAAVDVKAVALDPEEMPVGLAVAGRLTLPTGREEVALGSGAVGYELSLIGSQRFDAWTVAANLATRGVPVADLGGVAWGPYFVARGAVGRDIGDDAGASLELSAASVYASFLADAATSPVEVMGAGWYRVRDEAVVRLGAGTGLTQGVGAPLVRVIAAVGFEPYVPPDRDADGIADRKDACIDVPEDLDTFEDLDGCPDPDNDRDGLADVDDACVMDPEDRDQWVDEDGCPDPDNDGDGLADTGDACANVPEDADAWEDTDGCPEPTIVRLKLTGEDGAPVKFAEVLFGEQAAGAEHELKLEAGAHRLVATAPAYEALAETVEIPAGAPFDLVRPMVPDKGGTLELRVTSTTGEPIDAAWSFNAVGEPMSFDQERIHGGATRSRVPPGSYLVNVQSSGFASTTHKVAIKKGETTVLAVVLNPSRVVVQKDRIEILDKIYFDTNKTTIKKVSYPLLQEIARVLQEHPEVRKVRVEGHTDSRGSDTANLKLSDGRAKSVMAYLLKAGVSAQRLTAAGFGETRPVEKAESEQAWELNRRVEFVIEEREP